MTNGISVNLEHSRVPLILEFSNPTQFFHSMWHGKYHLLIVLLVLTLSFLIH